MSDIHVQVEEMRPQVGKLSAAGTQLDSHGSGAPRGMDAGPMTPILENALSKLIQSTGQLAQGLVGAGENLTTCLNEYEASDTSVQATFQRLAKGLF